MEEDDETKEIYLKDCQDITFKNIILSNEKEPQFSIDKNTVFNLTK